MAGGDIGERYDIVHPLVTQAVVPPQTGAPMGGAASMAGGGDVGLSFHRDQATGAVKIDKDRFENYDTEGTVWGAISGYKQTTVNLPPAVMSNGRGYVMIFWTPDRDSCAHYGEIAFSARVTAQDYVEGTKELNGLISLKSLKRGQAENELARKEQDEIKEVIRKLVDMSIKSQPSEVRELVKSSLSENRGWGVISPESPIIEGAWWNRASNKMEHHAAGIIVREGKNSSEKKPKHIVTTHYSDTENKITEDFQIVVPPFGGGITKGGATSNDFGSLLRHEKGEENTFVYNTVFTENYVDKLIGNSTSASRKVHFHSTHMLWAFQHMDMVFEEYLAGTSLGTNVHDDERKFMNMPTISTITKQLKDLTKDVTVTYASQLIEGALLILAKFASSAHPDSWFKFESTSDGYFYHVPSGFYHTIVQMFAKRLSKFQAFNGGTDLSIGAVALPSYNATTTSTQPEMDRSVYLDMSIKAYFTSMFWCYVIDTPAAHE